EKSAHEAQPGGDVGKDLLDICCLDQFHAAAQEFFSVREVALALIDIADVKAGGSGHVAILALFGRAESFLAVGFSLHELTGLSTAPCGEHLGNHMPEEDCWCLEFLRR